MATVTVSRMLVCIEDMKRAIQLVVGESYIWSITKTRPINYVLSVPWDR